MRMIQQRLDPKALKRARRADKPQGTIHTTFERFLNIATGNERTATPPLLPGEANTVPTIWFSPLIYQSREEVWSGLTHAILHQLADRFDTESQREEFWIRLQSSRIDPLQLQRDYRRLVWQKFLASNLGMVLVGLMCAALVAGILATDAVANSVLLTTATLGSFIVTAFGLWYT